MEDNHLELLFFIFGILFAYIAEPLLESIVGWIHIKIEANKGKSHITIAEHQKKIENIQEPITPKAPQIGFAIPNPIEEEWEEEDEPEGG